MTPCLLLALEERRNGFTFGASSPKENAVMKMHPRHDRVVVRRLEGDERSKGSIIVPDGGGMGGTDY